MKRSNNLDIRNKKIKKKSINYEKKTKIKIKEKKLNINIKIPNIKKIEK